MFILNLFLGMESTTFANFVQNCERLIREYMILLSLGVFSDCNNWDCFGSWVLFHNYRGSKFCVKTNFAVESLLFTVAAYDWAKIPKQIPKLMKWSWKGLYILSTAFFFLFNKRTASPNYSLKMTYWLIVLRNQ